VLTNPRYVVEKILSHRWEKSTGMLKFEVKWEGWEKKSDRTWEPEENLAYVDSPSNNSAYHVLTQLIAEQHL
jgi:hypothetical protein